MTLKSQAPTKTTNVVKTNGQVATELVYFMCLGHGVVYMFSLNSFRQQTKNMCRSMVCTESRDARVNTGFTSENRFQQRWLAGDSPQRQALVQRSDRCWRHPKPLILLSLKHFSPKWKRRPPRMLFRSANAKSGETTHVASFQMFPRTVSQAVGCTPRSQRASRGQWTEGELQKAVSLTLLPRRLDALASIPMHLRCGVNPRSANTAQLSLCKLGHGITRDSGGIKQIINEIS